MSRSKYWYQPSYCPPGGWLKREKSESSSSSCGPITGPMKASAIFGHATSMIAAPGSSIVAVQVLVQPAAATVAPGDEHVEHLLGASAPERPSSAAGATTAARCRSPGRPAWRTRSSPRSPRRATTFRLASAAAGCSRAGPRVRLSRCRPNRRPRHRSRGLRCCSSWSSCRRQGRRLGCAGCRARNPSHSYWPVPWVSSRGRRSRAASGIRPLVYAAMCSLSM